MKVLIIRFSSIGDIVLTSPIVRCLRQQRPDCKIHYLTKAEYRSTVAHNPHIDKLHYLENDLNVVIDELKKEKFDHVIDLHNNLRTARVKKALKVENYTFSKLNVKKWLLVNFKINLMPDQSIVDRYFDAIKPLGIHNDGQGLDYFIPEQAVVIHKDIPMSHWAGFVGCVVGGSYETKKLPIEQWKRFCALVPYPVILLGGPEDRDNALLIAAQDPVKIYNACGKFNLNESADLVNRAKVIVSNDTGLMHIAAAFKKPIISFWGNTSPEMGMFPYYGYNNLKERVAPQSILMENKQLWCHPCSKLGYGKCPKGHFKCMNSLDMNDVEKNIRKFW
ncbi:MAG: glycosyltransferase family 9 protein [Bacteroidota bacterium]